MSNSETNVIHRFAAGDEAAFMEIYDHYVSKLRFFALKYLSDEPMAEDVLQETFLSMWENRRKIVGEPELKSFIYTGVRNRCLNILRHEKTRRKYTLHAKNGVDDDYLNKVIESELYDLLRRVFDELPPASKQVYRMSLDGNTYEKIAEQLGISINTVKKYKNNANKYMRSRFGNLKALLSLF